MYAFQIFGSMYQLIAGVLVFVVCTKSKANLIPMIEYFVSIRMSYLYLSYLYNYRSNNIMHD